MVHRVHYRYLRGRTLSLHLLSRIARAPDCDCNRPYPFRYPHRGEETALLGGRRPAAYYWFRANPEIPLVQIPPGCTFTQVPTQPVERSTQLCFRVLKHWQRVVPPLNALSYQFPGSTSPTGRAAVCDADLRGRRDAGAAGARPHLAYGGGGPPFALQREHGGGRHRGRQGALRLQVRAAGGSIALLRRMTLCISKWVLLALV